MELLFGIPELDRMLDLRWRSEISYINKYAPSRASSLSILGPDGTGKSVLALHLAARYCAECVHQTEHKGSLLHRARVLYISTDLRHDSAQSIWNNFALGKPFSRNIPFERWKNSRQRFEDERGSVQVGLKPLNPGENSVIDFLSVDPPPRNVGFIDLASETAGDDWRYTNRILSLLDKPARTSDGRIVPHLVIIDSVAGFETLVGELDAFGEKSSRRAHIAQIMRASRERCHVVFSVEEPEEEKHLPEEFVTDIVIRLRRSLIDGSLRRTLEIEKARAKTHATGRHAFDIRDGKGSKTGVYHNPDDPTTSNDEGQETSYVAIFPSLSYRQSRMAALGEAEPERPDAVADFGVYFLDNLLVSADRDRDDKGIAYDPLYTSAGPWDSPILRGLSRGTVNCLIGEPGTGKSALADKFLCQAFASWPSAYRETLSYLRNEPSDMARLWRRFRRWMPEGNDSVYDETNKPPAAQDFVATCLQQDAERAAQINAVGYPLDSGSRYR